MKVTGRTKDYKRGKGSIKASGIVFIDEERPIDRGDIAEDLAWRRTVNYQSLTKNAALLALVAKEFKTTVDKVTLSFSRKAGCSMCPCSPGLLVHITGESSHWVLDTIDVRI